MFEVFDLKLLNRGVDFLYFRKFQNIYTQIQTCTNTNNLTDQDAQPIWSMFLTEHGPNVFNALQLTPILQLVNVLEWFRTRKSFCVTSHGVS